MLKQRTIQRPIRATGIGLHSGQKVYLGLLPHHADGGIVFRRTDLTPPVEIPASALIWYKVMCGLVRSNI
jgi:UDP-3-O-[3-hydroxymyristoyl] N-acetylglucosamine deacetylase